MSKNFSRRAFLKGAAALSLAAASATLLTGCSLDDVANLFGPQKGVLTDGDFSCFITLKGCQYNPYYVTLSPQLEVKSQFVDPVELATTPDSSKAYQIIPTFTYIGSDQPLTFEIGRGFENDPVAPGETQTGYLVVVVDPSAQWTGVVLTLTLYKNGDPSTTSKAIKFTLKK